MSEHKPIAIDLLSAEELKENVRRARAILDQLGGPPTIKTIEESIKRSHIELEAEKSARGYFGHQREELIKKILIASCQPTRWDDIETEASEDFKLRWSFLVSLCADPKIADDILDCIQDAYERNLRRYGAARAQFLYRKDVLRSIWPILKWTLHRTIVVGVIKHYLPSVESILRLFH